MSAALSIDWIRAICMALPYVTETVQWGDNLVFKIGGKIFAIAPLEPAKSGLSFKCTKEGYDELIERPGIIPAPYLARAYWVALEDGSAMPRAEVKRRLEEAYAIVLACLPKKVRAALDGGVI
ncbi:MAG TPA: MmcQ/YjbR family DNA-binding protein [Bryobacteraceae bacterium]|nr:MmcQ/YjbR family DNA-binding protein [Bryobacteraceae bacterium]HPT25465.1 MmcQ/YjbR family DNA-binding protein [Bryobacteraceae bacterium]